MTKPIGKARVEGDFASRSGAPVRFEAYGRAYSMETHDGRYFISVARNARPAEKFEVHYTLGARRFQGYLSKLADGRIYVLPVFWHNESKRWLDWKEITPVPDDPDHDLRQIWNVSCVNCHATNLVKNFDPSTNRYATTWTEMGIGCEACHGPGAAHVGVTTAWERNPATKPRDPGRADLEIFSPNHATPRQVFDACGYCHGNKTNAFFGFKPGDRYEDFALPFLVSEPIPPNDPQGEFWPDGRPSRFNRPQALTLTGCFQRGQATCTSCHRLHGSENDHALRLPIDAPGRGHTRLSDRLCTQCHDVEATHTHHAPESPGSRCIDCHMSDVNWRLITRRRDHTFQPPVPEMTARFGVPNACTTCHEDKAPEWAASIMDRWYGNADRRGAVVAMAQTIYRAGAGDVAVLPDVARLAVDRSRGALIRASAAEFAGQLIARGSTLRQAPGSPRAEPDTARPEPIEMPESLPTSVINALIGAAADIEPMVRISAVRALGRIDDPRATAVLAAHLADDSRLVRVRSAEALMNRGVSRLDGQAGAALARAQDEWAESLRTFNDLAGNHTALGWLQAERGQVEDAAKELRTAIALDPSDARPHVYLGLLAARRGQYADALQHFKTAKALSPTYPNLDRLIEEAQRRARR
jgi:predicted CXXCH cytochrome family protein